MSLMMVPTHLGVQLYGPHRKSLKGMLQLISGCESASCPDLCLQSAKALGVFGL